MTAQIISCTHEEYFDRREFSASTARVLIERSELHARHYLDHERAPSRIMDRGSVIHGMLLGRGAKYACLPFDDWRTKASKESRDNARASGLIPLLHHEHSEYETAAREIRSRLDAAGHFLIGGDPERAIVWSEQTTNGPLACKCMVDYLDLERATIYELKVTEDASPAAVERASESMGYRIAAAAYIRAVVALRPDILPHLRFRFLFVEPEPPYAIYDPPPTVDFLDGGERDWLRACESYARCVATGRWPGYEGRGEISRPAWARRKDHQ